MATQTARDEAQATDGFAITVKLALHGSPTEAVMKQLAEDVSKTLRDKADTTVIGIAVATSYDPAQLDICLDVASTSLTDAQDQVTAALSIIGECDLLDIRYGPGHDGSLLTVENSHTDIVRAPALVA